MNDFFGQNTALVEDHQFRNEDWQIQTTRSRLHFEPPCYHENGNVGIERGYKKKTFKNVFSRIKNVF